MSREIKFRAWDKLDNKMYYDVGLTLIGVIVYADPENQPPETELLNRGRNCFEIMEYTGMKDKAGQEIYEGDVLCNDNGPETFAVSFLDGVFCLGDRNMALWKGAPRDYWKILGNFYENPDLLTHPHA